MLRLSVGCWLVVSGVIACSESSGSKEAPAGGGSGGQGESGAGAGSASGGAPESVNEAAPYFEPGSRLKPKVFALDDGPDVLRDVVLDGSWYDSELEHDCLFLPDEAGVERCFPRQFLSGGTFADPDCTRRVLVDGAAGTCAAARYSHVTLNEGGRCGNRGFRVGERLPESTPLYFSTDGSSCQVSAQTESIPVYEVEEVPPETFVGMRRESRARAAGLDAYVREGDDGSWQIMGYFDAAREAACFDTFIGFEPTSKCVPAHASASWFEDAMCRTRVSSARLTACNVEQPTVLIAAQVDAGTCPMTRSFELYEIDGLRETSYHEVDGSGACVASKLPAGESYVQGAAIAPATLPTLESLVVGTGAVRALFSGFGGVPYVPIGYAHTGLLDGSGEPCHPFRFPDGSLRCVPISFPGSAPGAFAYEDASCEEAPVTPWVAKPTCPADPPLPRGVVLVDSTKCELAAVEVRAVVGQSTATAFYAKDAESGACQAIAASSLAPTYLRLGEALADTEFPDLKPTLRD